MLAPVPADAPGIALGRSTALSTGGGLGGHGPSAAGSSAQGVGVLLALASCLLVDGCGACWTFLWHPGEGWGWLAHRPSWRGRASDLTIASQEAEPRKRKGPLYSSHLTARWGMLFSLVNAMAHCSFVDVLAHEPQTLWLTFFCGAPFPPMFQFPCAARKNIGMCISFPVCPMPLKGCMCACCCYPGQLREKFG